MKTKSDGKNGPVASLGGEHASQFGCGSGRVNVSCHQTWLLLCPCTVDSLSRRQHVPVLWEAVVCKLYEHGRPLTRIQSRAQAETGQRTSMSVHASENSPRSEAANALATRALGPPDTSHNALPTSASLAGCKRLRVPERGIKAAHCDKYHAKSHHGLPSHQPAYRLHRLQTMNNGWSYVGLCDPPKLRFYSLKQRVF